MDLENIAVVGVHVKRIRLPVRREGDVVGVAAAHMHALDVDIVDLRQRDAQLLQHAVQGLGYADLRIRGVGRIVRNIRLCRGCRSPRRLCRFLRALHIEDITGARGDRVAVFPVGRRKADTVGELTAVLRQLLRAVGRIDRRVAAHDHAHVVLGSGIRRD